MPILPENKARYSRHWPAISRYVRFHVANGRCQMCDAENYLEHPVTGSKVILTVMHLDHRPENNCLGNLRAACQRCHNAYDAEHRRQTTRRRSAVADLFAGEAA